MSYREWTVDGYGCEIPLIEGTLRQVELLVRAAPNFEKTFIKARTYAGIELGEDASDEEILNRILSYEWDTCETGYGAILANVINEAEDIELTACTDYNGVQYLILQPAYPWSEISDNEKRLTGASLQEIFEKYFQMLGADPGKLWYQEVEQGG